MKKALLFVLALTAVGCAEGELEESASCADLSVQSPLEDLRTCAEQGDARAQTNLGRMYANGRGVPEDKAEAVRWYRLGAEQGYAIAQTTLGLMYSLGDGVPQDYVEAARWLRLAAEQGDAVAQYNLERLSDGGEGAPYYLAALAGLLFVAWRALKGRA